MVAPCSSLLGSREGCCRVLGLQKKTQMDCASMEAEACCFVDLEAACTWRRGCWGDHGAVEGVHLAPTATTEVVVAVRSKLASDVRRGKAARPVLCNESNIVSDVRGAQKQSRVSRVA